jgi:nucleolin
VDFETIASATKAIETLNQQLFEGRRLAVQYAAYTSRTMDSRTAQTGGPADRPRKPLNPPSKTLFIGNMSFEMTDRDLNALFRGIKNVIDVRVAIDRRTGQPRGFAHADFIDTQSATEAFKILEAKETYGRKLRLDYSYGPSNAPRNSPGADRERGRQAEQVGEQEDN